MPVGRLGADNEPDRRNSFGVGDAIAELNVDSLRARQRWAVLQIPFRDQLRIEASHTGFLGAPSTELRVAAKGPVQLKLFLEEDVATRPTLASLQRVYVG